MAPAPQLQAIDVDDGTLRRVVDDAHLPSLLAALAVALDDRTLLREELRPNPATLGLAQGGLSEEQQTQAKELAVAALIRLRDDGAGAPELPEGDAFLELVEFLAGGMDISDSLTMLREELALHDDPRRPTWTKDELAPTRPFNAVIIGAGMSGILAAYRLQQAGIPFVVLEKNQDVGGTWHENQYPGCRVDIANHYYSYSFAQRNWPQFFSPQATLQQYFRECVDEFGIRDSIRFGTEVDSIEFDDASATWTVCSHDADGHEATTVAHVVISAVGQLNKPSIPEIAGLQEFGGETFHSAQWRHDVDLTGKRVAVIGTGCSAVQFAPFVAEQAEQVTIFQRTPNWMVARPDYKADVPDGFQWLLQHVPYYREWYRLFLFWATAGWGPSPGDVDPDWPDKTRSVSAMNEMVREMFAGAMASQYVDRPDLVEKVIPDYPPVSKRIIVDGGDWAKMLLRDDVDLVTTEIDHVDASGIVAADGTRYPADVIIFGTGFRASHFLTPMKVVGRGGADLHDRWDGDDARAYLGTAVPGFPNFFMLYGPNTNLVVSGSIIWFSECTVRYIVGYLEELLRSGARAFDLKPAVHDAFNAEIDDANVLRAWAISPVNTWYRNSRGRATQNWPFSLLKYWELTAAFAPEEFETL